MSRLYINDYVNNLQQQISSSVVKIRRKSSGAEQPAAENPEDGRSGYGRRVEGYAYQLLPGEVTWSMQGEGGLGYSGGEYAANSYQKAKDVMREPTVLIDFVFKNNREFDFKV